MKKIHIVIMGRTGVGKSTIVNSVMGEDVAESGDGPAVTRENKVYESERNIKIASSVGTSKEELWKISLYDTVGLEIDQKITKDTLQCIKSHITHAKNESDEQDVTVVWFCINEQTHRFESYESDLIKKLSMEYEIPFVIVLTQCVSKKNNELATEIQKRIPNMPIFRIMAKDYMFDDDIVIRSYGLDSLLLESITNYYKYKIQVIDTIIDSLTITADNKMRNITDRGNKCISKCSHNVGKIAWVPLGCIPYVHGKCIQMISDLNAIAGLSKDEDFADEIFTDVVLGVLATPLMAVPLLSSLAAQSYIEVVGENYLKALIEVIKISSESELKNKKIMKEKMKQQLKSI